MLIDPSQPVSLLTQGGLSFADVASIATPSFFLFDNRKRMRAGPFKPVTENGSTRSLLGTQVLLGS